jgi:hypothetical protein
MYKGREPMSFKEKLLKKIRVDKMAEKVIKSFGTPDSGRKTDKATMRELLTMSPYSPRRERDLELYTQNAGSGTQRILVLDNELPLYNTTVEDVVLRKSPTLKEMISIRNARKILNDTDVLVSKKGDSVNFFRNELINSIDLSFGRPDIEEIEKDGIASLERGYSEGVTEALELYSELLGFSPLPKEFMASGNIIIGQSGKKDSGETFFGPFIIYSLIHNTIKLFDERIGVSDKDKIELLHMTVSGKAEAAMEGPEVFQYLTDSVFRGKKNQG